MTAQINTSNYGTVKGRLSKDVTNFPNSKGGKTVIITLAVENAVKLDDGTKTVEFLSFEDVVGANQSGARYDIVHKGDSVEIMYELKNNDHDKKSGEHYYGMKAMIRSIEKLETKAVTDARLAARTTGAAQTEEAPVVNEEALPFN